MVDLVGIDSLSRSLDRFLKFSFLHYAKICKNQFEVHGTIYVLTSRVKREILALSFVHALFCCLFSAVLKAAMVQALFKVILLTKTRLLFQI